MDLADVPTFGAELRRQRLARGMSLRDFAKLVHHSKTVVWEWETNRKQPSTADVAGLDAVLNAQGVVIAAARRFTPRDPEPEADRLGYVAAAPCKIDRAAVDALRGVLANMRRLEDSLGSAPIVAATAGPTRLVQTLTEEARGAVRRDVIGMAGQWAQFAGWLRASTGQWESAREWYARSLEHATEVGDANLVSTALSMRGNLAWLAGRPGPVVGLSAAAACQAASPGIQAIALQQEARGHALMGDIEMVDRRLDRATELMMMATAAPDREPPWIYFYSPGYLTMQRGLAYQLLGRHEDAIAQLTSGLEQTASGLRHSEFVTKYVLHLAQAHHDAGNDDEATRLLEEARGVAVAMESGRLPADVQRLVRQLSLD